MNGDGYGDVLNNYKSTSGPNKDGVTITLGSATGLPAAPAQVLDAPNPTGGNNNQVLTLSMLGDVNGDTLADFAFGARIVAL